MFIVHYIGTGDGCGYYVGCNEKLETLPDSIKTMESALKYVAKKALDDYGGTEVIETFCIYEVSQSKEFSLEEIEDALKFDQIAAKKQQLEEQERLEYMRLKAKYEGD
jgi:hypothetical protein